MNNTITHSQTILLVDANNRTIGEWRLYIGTDWSGNPFFDVDHGPFKIRYETYSRASEGIIYSWKTKAEKHGAGTYTVLCDYPTTGVTATGSHIVADGVARVSPWPGSERGD